MAKTYSQLKKSVLGNNYSIKKRDDEVKKSYADIKSGVMEGQYNFSRVKASLEEQIRFDTFAADLSSMGKTIGDISANWQPPETMKSKRTSVESMQNRLRAYKEYNQLFGGGNASKDVSKAIEGYGSVLDNWDALSDKYSQYKDSRSYTQETKKLRELSKMNSSDVSGVMKGITDLEGQLKTAKGYESKIKSLKDTQDYVNTRAHGLTAGLNADKIKDAEREYKNYLKSIGYESIADIENALSGKKIAYTTVGGENITWQSLYDSKKSDEEHKKLYSEISSRKDFKKYTAAGANIKNPSFEDYNKGPEFFGWKPMGEDINNKMEFFDENRTMAGLTNDSRIIYSEATQEEKNIYNYYLGREKEGLEKQGTADNYLKSIESKLKNRHENRVITGLSEYADEHPVLASALSVGQNLFSSAEYLKDSAKYLKTGEIDTNHLAQASTAIRSTVSNKVDWEIGNWDAFDFLYNSGMSMLDSSAAMVIPGKGGAALLFGSAAAQGTNDALARGLDNKGAFWGGFSAGVFEGLFESFSIGKFKALKDVPVDGVKAVIKNVGKSMLTNASEETLTELANLTYDYFANGDLSQAKTNIRAYMSAGMSEKEAISKVALEQAAQVAEAGASGALMGLGFGGVAGTSAYVNTKNIGKNIRANEHVSELFDLASVSPEASLAYEAYTRYANKGINADNIKNAQLGNLWQNARMDKQNIVNNAESSASEVLFAKDDYSKLEDYVRPNASAILKREVGKKLIDKGLKMSKDTENYKIAKELQAKVKNGDFLSEEEVEKLSNATEEALKAETKTKISKRLNELGDTDKASEIADIISRKLNGEIITSEELKTVQDSKNGAQVLDENINPELTERVSAMEKEDADLFIRLYDGKTDLDAYSNAFNLMKIYANNPDSYSQEYALENKWVLSTRQATEIYKTTIMQASAFRKANAELTARARQGERGIINDSIVNYGNNYVGGKVNWGSLKDSQKQSVVFLKGLYKVLNSNITFVGKDKRFNGAYDVGTDMTYVDIYAGIDLNTNTGKEAVLLTASHELTHEMEVKSPELFDMMSKIVLDSLSKSTGLSKNELIANEIARLNEKHPEEGEHTEKDAISEIVARACEGMLLESKEARKMLNSLSESEQKTLVEHIKDIIQKIVDWIDDFLGKYDVRSKEAKALKEMKEAYEAMSILWDKMLLDVQKVNKSLEKDGAHENDGAVEGDMRYYLREEAITEVEQAISDKNYDKEIKLTDNSPAILVSQKGVRNLPMMMVASHVRENILTETEAKSLGLTVNIHKHYHGLGKTLFLNVVDGLDDVTEAYRGTKNAEKSERRENYFLLISKYKDSNGDTINVPVYVNQHGQYNRIFVDTNKVATVFGRNNFKTYIQNEIAKGNLVRIKNRSNQASESTSLIDGDYGKNASKDSIHNSNGNVNTKFSDKDSSVYDCQ